jgi:short-subunit dehydrogenase
MQKDLAGKIIITGATEGIGKAAAHDFARRGATLTIIGRQRDKTARVLDELKTDSGNEKIDMLLCDLSRLADVRRARPGDT